MSCSVKSTKNWMIDKNYLKEDRKTIIGGKDTIQKVEKFIREHARKKYGELPESLSHNDIFTLTKGGKVTLYSDFFKWVDRKNNSGRIFSDKKVNYSLKAVEILNSDKAKQVFEKGKKNNWDLAKILTELQIPKEQKQIILDKGIKDREEIITSLLSENSFVVEVKTAVEKSRVDSVDGAWTFNYKGNNYYSVSDNHFTKNGKNISEKEFKDAEKNSNLVATTHYISLGVPGGTNYTENEISTPLITPNIKGHAQFSTDNGIGWFRSDEQAIKPKYEVKTHEDGTNEVIDNSSTRGSEIRRILEIQSDLFQKGRDSKDLIGGVKKTNELNTHVEEEYQIGNFLYFKEDENTYTKNNLKLSIKDNNKFTNITKEEYIKNIPDNKIQDNDNKFLQLLNKKGNWINFFIQSIIQDSVRKGYKTVLFPTGETAAKIEGHETIAERINFINKRLEKFNNSDSIKLRKVTANDVKFNKELIGSVAAFKNGKLFYKSQINSKSDLTKKELDTYIKKEIGTLEQEKQEMKTQGLEKLKPIESFYTNRVTNILNKLYDVKEITDEHENSWNEIDITNEKNQSSNILLKRPDWTTIIDDSKQSIFTKESKKNTVKTTPEHKIDVLFNGKQGKITVNEILNNIRSNFNGISQNSKDVIEKIDTFAKLTKANIKFVAESVLETDDTIMQYDDVTDTIMLNRDRLKGYSAKQVAESFLHEVTHSITVKVLNNPTTMDAKMAVAQLEEILKTYKEKSTEKDTYGFTNIHEFVAEARNNSTFQNELKELDKGKNSLWQRLVKAIRTLLGLKSNYQNTLDAIMNLEKESTKVDVLETSNRIFRDSKPTLKTKLDEVVKTSKEFIISSNQKGESVYIKEGLEYERQSNFVTRKNKENKTTSINMEMGAAVGNLIDILGRDIFEFNDSDYASHIDEMKSMNLGDGKVNVEVDITENVYNNLKNNLIKVRDDLKSKGYKFLANDLIVFEEFTDREKSKTGLHGIAGALDLLAYNNKNEIIIIDLKNIINNKYLNSNINGPSKFTTKKESWSKQQTIYRNLLERHLNFKIKSINTLPIASNYSRDVENRKVVVSSFQMAGDLINLPSNIFNNHMIMGLTNHNSMERTLESALISSKNTESRPINSSIEDDEKDLSTVENRLEKRREDLMHIVKLQMRKLERGNKKKTKSFTADLKIALAALEKYQGLDTYKGIIEYLKNATSALTAMESALMTKDMSTEDMKYALKTNRDYFQLYSIVKDIQHSKRDIFRSNPDISEEDKETVNRLLSASTGKYESLHGLYQTAAKDFMSNHLNNVKYHPAIVTRWEEKFRKEYNEIHQGNKKALNNKVAREEWVTGKLLEVNDEIKAEIEDNVEKLIYNKAYDISTYTRWFLSSIETNDDMVQIMQVMLSEIRDNIIRDVLPINKEMAELHAKFVKGKSNNPTKLYKNIFEKTSGGKFYLKGAIKAEFGHKYAQLEALRDQIRDLNVNSLSEDDKLLLVDLKKERDALHNELFITDNNTLRSEIKSVWKNDLSTLTDGEKEILEYFKKVSDDSAKVSHGWNTLKSLVIYDGNKKITYYRLPAISKSDTERMLDGTLGKDRMARVKDKFQVQSDDIGYEHTKRVNIDGSDIMDLKLHFRGDMEEGNQSVDLFSLYKMEVNNYIAYKHRNKNKIDIDLFLNIAEDKEYIHDKNVMSWLTKSQVSAKHDVKESNTVMKLRGIIENQMYDITKRFSGKVAGADVNKIVSSINGYTGMVGMTLNYFSATANLISGNVQTALHAFNNDIMSPKDLKKAMDIYIKNTGANINDLGKVYDESFTNQILNEFDVFGGFNVGSESFLKDAKWKSIVSKHSLQFMHTMGEHQIQAVMTMAVLNSIQAYNINGKSINGTSLLDNLSVDKDTRKLKMNKDVVYTSHSKLIKWNEGGRSEVQRLIKSKLIATQGLYDNNLQSELMKTSVGRLGNMYRKFFIPMVMERYRGIATVGKERSSLEEHEKYYSYAEKRYKEGSYVSLVNYIKFGILPHINVFKKELATTNWSELTDYQRSNIKKAISEIVLGTTIPILASMAANAAGDDDDELLYFIAYEISRVSSELQQFYDINDTFRMTKTPFAGMHMLENNYKFLSTFVSTANPFSETPRVKSGKNKGDLKLKKKTLKIFPIFNRVGVTNKERYNYLKVLTNSN